MPEASGSASLTVASISFVSRSPGWARRLGPHAKASENEKISSRRGRFAGRNEHHGQGRLSRGAPGGERSRTRRVGADAPLACTSAQYSSLAAGRAHSPAIANRLRPRWSGLNSVLSIWYRRSFSLMLRRDRPQ